MISKVICAFEAVSRKGDFIAVTSFDRNQLDFSEIIEEIKSFSSDNGISVEEGDLQGKLSLLKKYLSLLSHHVSDVMPLAISYGSEGPVQYVHACGILQKDVIGHLLPGTVQVF